ncbi:MULTISPECIES: hypothetical protein [Oscillatoriales]|uniref:hypothetical protein n=1 Tax=Limnospira platensis TaxID=118562 RepID=UPI0009EDDB56|nr:hypothetical protein AP9108_17775 [Arthrospira sp. PCC 9108]
MREVEERSRRVKDIVRNRNYRQAIDVIEREVKRLEADDKPRARVRFPRDDGDIDIDVGGIVDFARSMLPKASIEAEDLQDGGTRRGIKTEKIGSTARGFVDLDEDGNPKGFGGTIDSINDANVSVYLGECEQSMSVTIGGKTVTFARNVCEDDKDEGADDNKGGGDEDKGDESDAGRVDLGISGPPPGYTGWLCMAYWAHIRVFQTDPIKSQYADLVESFAGKSFKNFGSDIELNISMYSAPYISAPLVNLGYTNPGSITAFRRKLQEEEGFLHSSTTIKERISVTKLGKFAKESSPRYFATSTNLGHDGYYTVDSIAAPWVANPNAEG